MGFRGRRYMALILVAISYIAMVAHAVMPHHHNADSSICIDTISLTHLFHNCDGSHQQEGADCPEQGGECNANQPFVSRLNIDNKSDKDLSEDFSVKSPSDLLIFLIIRKINNFSLFHEKEERLFFDPDLLFCSGYTTVVSLRGPPVA